MQAMGGVVLSQSLTTESSSVVVSTGTGSLTVVSTMSLSTTGQLLTITADDFDLNGEVSSGTHTTIIECTSAGRTVGLGAGAGDLSINAMEMGMLD